MADEGPLPDTLDPFELLGIREDADAVQAKRAYLRRVKRFPPERHPEEFQRIRAAYELIRDFFPAMTTSAAAPPSAEATELRAEPRPSTNAPRPTARGDDDAELAPTSAAHSEPLQQAARVPGLLLKGAFEQAVRWASSAEWIALAPTEPVLQVAIIQICSVVLSMEPDRLTMIEGAYGGSLGVWERRYFGGHVVRQRALATRFAGWLWLSRPEPLVRALVFGPVLPEAWPDLGRDLTALTIRDPEQVFKALDALAKEAPAWLGIALDLGPALAEATPPPEERVALSPLAARGHVEALLERLEKEAVPWSVWARRWPTIVVCAFAGLGGFVGALSVWWLLLAGAAIGGTWFATRRAVRFSPTAQNRLQLVLASVQCHATPSALGRWIAARTYEARVGKLASLLAQDRLLGVMGTLLGMGAREPDLLWLDHESTCPVGARPRGADCIGCTPRARGKGYNATYVRQVLTLGSVLLFLTGVLATISPKDHELRTVRYDNGDVYFGATVRGRKEGRGTYTYANGDEYVGGWRRDKPEGRGLYTWKSPGGHYRGDFQGGRMEGHGERTWSSGRHYVGQWHENEPHGYGTMSYPDGQTYVGAFQLGIPHGPGRMTTTEGTVLEGRWQLGRYVAP